MKRRYVPFGFAFVVLAVCLSPLVLDVNVNTADLYTLPIASLIFTFKAIMFCWMRHRMRTDPRKLTMFGVALMDFFTGLTLFAITLAFVYGYIFWLALEEHPIPRQIRTLNRAAVISGGSLIVATGIAVAYELHRAGALPSVHLQTPKWDGTEERRVGPLDRRKSEAL